MTDRDLNGRFGNVDLIKPAEISSDKEGTSIASRRSVDDIQIDLLLATVTKEAVPSVPPPVSVRIHDIAARIKNGVYLLHL